MRLKRKNILMAFVLVAALLLLAMPLCAEPAEPVELSDVGGEVTEQEPPADEMEQDSEDEAVTEDDEGMEAEGNVEEDRPVEEEPAPMDPTERLRGMAPWEMLQDNALLKEFYEIDKEYVEPVNGAIVKIKVLRAKYDSMATIAAPMSVVMLSSGGFEVRHPLYPSRRMQVEYSVPKSKPALITITESCGCPDPYKDIVHMFMLYKGSLMRPLGAVSGVEDIDGDSLVEPFMYDTSFVEGLGFMPPGTGPVIKVYFTYKGGRLINDPELFRAYYDNRLASLKSQIESARSASPDAADISPMFEMLLYYRALGLPEEGWKTFEADVMSYGGVDLPVMKADGTVERVPVEEVVSRTRRAMGRSWNR